MTEIQINEFTYINGRCDLEHVAGLQVVVRLSDGSEVTGKLAGYYPTGFELQREGVKPKYFYFDQVASVRAAPVQTA